MEEQQSSTASSSSSKQSYSAKELASKVKTIFNATTLENRKSIQVGLQRLGVYKSSIDGQWGRGTEGGFINLFEFLDKFYPNQEYVQTFGFNKSTFTVNEFGGFWNNMFSGDGCEDGRVLSVTSVCGK